MAAIVMLNYPHVTRFIDFKSPLRLNHMAGWQYLFSPEYRRMTHDRWQNKNRLWIAVQILGATLGMGFTGMIAGFAAMATWSLF